MVIAGKTGELAYMTALPQLAAAVLVDVGEKVFRIAAGIFPFVNDPVSTMFDGIETESC